MELLERKQALMNVIEIKEKILYGVEDLYKIKSAKVLKEEAKVLIPFVEALGKYENVKRYLKDYTGRITKDLEKVIVLEEDLELDKKNKEKQKTFKKKLQDVLNAMAMDIRHLGFAREEEEQLQIISMPGFYIKAQSIITLIAELQSSAGPAKVYAILKQTQDLLNKHTGDSVKKAQEGIADVLANEMRDYYKTKHENQRIALVEKVNKIVMPNI